MEDSDLLRDEIKERDRRYQLKKELEKELEARLAVERKKWEKHVTLDISNSVFLTLRDEKGDQKEFILIAIRNSNGVLGKPMKVDLKLLLKLAKEKKLNLSSWINQITFGSKPFFPFAPDEDLVKVSPTFLLVQNKGYIEDMIDPYNVQLAGFLFVNYPKYGNFLEAVSGSVVGNLAVIEQIMRRNNEPYSRENHLLNWLHFFLSRDSEHRHLKFQMFNMAEKWVPSYTKYLRKHNSSFK
ncbi:MAG: hypothetical protein EU536_00975 [Promethearchaeota archaeon]|nr:MAG: hypothetical protein EU536_00975 [Candidatus Lokiarchaeota archaeon]